MATRHQTRAHQRAALGEIQGFKALLDRETADTQRSARMEKQTSRDEHSDGESELLPIVSRAANDAGVSLKPTWFEITAQLGY